jgi:short subunit fatty acids transporter
MPPVFVPTAARADWLARFRSRQQGNLVTPFWAAVGAGIARIDFRRFIGYQFVYAAIWFVLGVLVFTLL